MRPNLSAIAAKQNGVFLRRQVLESGFSPDEVRQLVWKKEWTAIRRGAYVATAAWAAMDRAERYRALCFAVAVKLGDEAVLSHISATAIHGLPTWGLDLESVHVARARTSRIEAGIVHHRSPVPEEMVVRRDGLNTSSVPRAIVETALISPFEPSLAVADAALHAGLATHRQLLEAVDSMRDWPGARNAGRVVGFADGLAESVGESRARIAFDEAGLPSPTLQYEVHDRSGRLFARTDFCFEEYRTVAEFDGKIKYTGELAPGGDATEALFREKKREDRLRAMGFQVVRITWSDLDRPQAIGARVREAFARA